MNGALPTNSAKTWIQVKSKFIDYGWIWQEPLNLPGQKTRSKNFKTPFFRDIQISFHGVADAGLEPHQKIFFEKISTNMVARGIGSFGTLGGAADPLIE